MVTFCMVNLIFILALAAPATPQTPPQELIAWPDLILHGGKILTADSDNSETFTIAQAIAIREGKVLKVGRDAEILRLAGSKTKKLDLQGKTVIPGIIDTHSVLFEYALSHWEEDLAKIEPQIAEFRKVNVWAIAVWHAKRKIRSIVKKAGPGRWVRVVVRPGRVAREMWRTLTLADIDALSPDNPLVVRTARTGTFYNSKVGEAILERFGDMGDELVDEKGNYHGRGGVGPIRSIVTDILVKHPLKSLTLAYRKGMEEWASYGITTWSASLSPLASLRVYSHLDRLGQMPIRFAYSHAMGFTGTKDEIGFAERLGDMAGHGTPYLWNIGISTRGIDGAYPRHCTTLTPKPAELKASEWCRATPGSPTYKALVAAVRSGLRLSGIHVGGDASADYFLQAVEEGSRQAGMTEDEIRAKHHAIDHCSMYPRPDQIERATRLGIIWSCRPQDIVEARLLAESYGERVAHEWVVPSRRILGAGGMVVGEFHEDLRGDSPFRHIQLLLTRKDKNGDVWGADQAVDRRTALLMFTRWAAAYVLREDVLGSLEPGKLADLAVLDRDYLAIPVEKLPQVKVLMTLVGGKVAYQAAGFSKQ